MPRIIECNDRQRISLGDCAEALAAEGLDPACDDSVAHGARLLRQLGNDPAFLGDVLLAELRESGAKANASSAYGPQAIVLSDPRHGAFLRANIWPAPTDHCYRSSGAHSFAYGLPHDHNFDFLTLGYFGPGYESDYWEYDHEAVAGVIGEPAGLRFIERACLSPGKLMLYRAHRDVHAQLPPQSLSVSLNIMASDPTQAWRDQYRFDTEKGTIAGVLSPTSTETFLRIAVASGHADALDLADDWGRSHPVDRIRLASFEARAERLDRAEADQLWASAEDSGSRLVAAEARRNRAALETV